MMVWECGMVVPFGNGRVLDDIGFVSLGSFMVVGTLRKRTRGIAERRGNALWEWRNSLEEMMERGFIGGPDGAGIHWRT